MIRKIKQAVQGRLYARCMEEYRRELRSQTDPYLLWVKEMEAGAEKKQEGEAVPDVEIVYMEHCGRNFSLSRFYKKYLLFVSGEGQISSRAFYAFARYFETHRDVHIAYADEDVLWRPDMDADIKRKAKDAAAERIFPWTKPVWSPDTLLSFLYFGNIFAVRREMFTDVPWLGDDDYRKNIYDFVLRATEQSNYAGHIDDILFHRSRYADSRAMLEKQLMQETDMIGVGSAYDAVRESAFQRRGVKGKMMADEKTGISYPLFAPGRMSGEDPLVSIVIPSKDNPEVLRQCIRSIYAHTDYPRYEVIVVDNGSTERVREDLEQFRQECPFTYLYQPMDFNFSRMCNLGAEEAKGTYLLLLNDDMEVLEGSWLKRLAGQASLEHVGAVGAKLLYPDSTKIQHAGITNTLWGPGHKLKLLDDRVSYYYGRNRFIYDLIGVTAACLLMRREVFFSLGGLCEELAVAYNDVDLCFRLYEKGLYCVQRNDVALYHHESLSRGDDMQDERKLKRLMEEKDLLYSRHTKLYAKDPFIGTMMNSGEPEYACRWPEGYELVHLYVHDNVLKEGKKLPDVKSMNQAIMIVVENCGRENFAQASTGNGKERRHYYLIKGWAYVPGADNARYQFRILLVNGNGRVWELPVQKRYRKDVAAILPDEANVELTGFCCWIFEGVLPPDTYDLWMAANDRCSRQRLYRSMERKLVVKG